MGSHLPSEDVKMCDIAADLDPRFHELKFMSSDDILKVQSNFALQARRSEKEHLKQPSVEQDDSASIQPVSKRRPMSVLNALPGSDSIKRNNEENNGQ